MTRYLWRDNENLRSLTPCQDLLDAPLAPPPASLVDVDFVTPGQGWGLTAAGALYATADGGGAWTAVSVPVAVGGIHLLSPAVGWAAGAGEILTTTDGGASWKVAQTLPGAPRWTGPAWFTWSSPNRGWALLASGQGCASQEPYLLYGTSDGGARWQLALTGTGACFPSTAPGTGTTVTGPPASVPFGPGGYPSGLWSAGPQQAGLAVSSPAGSNVQFITVGPGGAVTALPSVRGAFGFPVAPTVDFVTPGDGWLAASTPHAGGLWHSTDGGASWQEAWELP